MHRDDPEWLRFVEEAKGKAIQHIESCMLLYRHQLRQGLHFVHEHPWGASSWKLKNVQDLIEDGRVTVAETHMCRFGMDSHISKKDGDRGLVKKPTGFMTSSKFVAAQLGKKCEGRHDHAHLVGGRNSGARVYPQSPCEAMLRGIARQKKDDAVN